MQKLEKAEKAEEAESVRKELEELKKRKETIQKYSQNLNLWEIWKEILFPKNIWFSYA